MMFGQKEDGRCGKLATTARVCERTRERETAEKQQPTYVGPALRTPYSVLHTPGPGPVLPEPGHTTSHNRTSVHHTTPCAEPSGTERNSGDVPVSVSLGGRASERIRFCSRALHHLLLLPQLHTCFDSPRTIYDSQFPLLFRLVNNWGLNDKKFA